MYSAIRSAVCRTGDDDCGLSGASGFLENTNVPALNMNHTNCVEPRLLRLRAIGGPATINVCSASDTCGLPPQMEEVRAQAFAAGGFEEDVYVGLPGTEVQTLKMVNKRLPSLFDYVLFICYDFL